MYAVLFEHFKKYVDLTEEEFAFCLPLLKQRNFKKRQSILQEGYCCLHLTFLIKGFTRTYQGDEKGQEHVLYFGNERTWVCDLYSFIYNVPSHVNIDCIEDCEVLQVSRQDVEVMFSKVPKLERYFRIIAQFSFISLQKRIFSNLSKSALERYSEFVDKFPEIVGRVPNHQVASYLGIAPQSLSRIRRQLFSNN